MSQEYVTTVEAKQLQGLISGDKPIIVEVGAWKGFTTIYLAQAVRPLGGKVFVVDHWRGNEDTWSQQTASEGEIYAEFKANISHFGVSDLVHALVMDSQTACSIFADGMANLVFIDADHRYEYIKADILGWLPKVKVGGILCGHDCERFYLDCPDGLKQEVDEHKDEDYIQNSYHPGVIRALYDCFNDDYLKLKGGTIWCYSKGVS